MESRKEYFAKYYLEHPELLTKQKKYYRKNKKKRLQYQTDYDTEHKETRKLKNKERDHSFVNHIGNIVPPCIRYAKDWDLPHDSQKELSDWAKADPTYAATYDAWKAAGYPRNLSPVMMRRVKKLGFVRSNLEWHHRGDYSWWSIERELRDAIEKEIDAEHRVRNKGTPEWAAGVRKQWTAQKNKKK